MRPFQILGIILAFFLSHAQGSGAESSHLFNPRDYEKQVARCPATRRNTNPSASVDIDIRYVEINPKAENTMIMVHGWPSLWSSFSYQVKEFENDYHLLLPDLRGFGESTHPDDVQSSGTMGDMVADLVCILKQADVASAICIGHDWGSQICYEAARMRPDLFHAVVGIAIPYIPAAGPFVSIGSLLPHFPKLAYQLFFQSNTSAAVAELDRDIRRSIRATLRTKESPPPNSFLTGTDSFLSGWSGVTDIPPVPFFTADEEDYFVEQYTIQGFRNTLQFYTAGNRYASWEFTHEQGNHTIPQPVLAVLPLDDPVGDWVLASKLLHSADFLPHLTTEVLEGAHWVHLEYPQKFNGILRQWLSTLPASITGIRSSRDEL